jgi:Bacterial TSP3 repeat
MKTTNTLLCSLLLLTAQSVSAATTIDPFNKYAYGANLGWLDWSGGSGQTTTGVVIGQYVCSGYIYSANVGWINLGSGSPANQIQYQNNSATDFGVNQDGLGNLSGYAYGANIGWITFEQAYGQPRINLITGQMSGSVWSANCGWISLSNVVAYVQTDSISPGALDVNGLPIAWELQNFKQTGIDPNADPDGDGLNNRQEYLAGTDPNLAGSNLKIIDYMFASGGTSNAIAWNSVTTRYYYLQKSLSLNSNVWTDSGLGLIPPASGAISFKFTDTNAPARFYRVQAVRPLMP